MIPARGFTLVEILVALMMFAVVGGTLLQLFGSGLRTARLAADHTHAIFHARSKLTELQALSHLDPGTIDGDFGDGYRWQAVLSPPPDREDEPPGALAPLELDLTISWGEADEERSFHLKSLLLSQAVAP